MVVNHFEQKAEVDSIEAFVGSGTMKIKHNLSVEYILKELDVIGHPGKLVEESKPVQPVEKKTDISIYFATGFLILGFLFTFIWPQKLLSVFSFAIVMILTGRRPAKNAFYALKVRLFDMNVLMVTAAIGATFIGEWTEGALVLYLFAIGTYLQNRAIDRTRNSVSELLKLTPETGSVLIDDQEIIKPVDEINVNSILRIRPGDRIPLDGEVVRGSSAVDQSPITGESIPVEKQSGDEVYSGSLNQNGLIDIRVTQDSRNSTLARIIRQVQEAQDNKAPTEVFIDRFSKIYTPIVFVLSFLLMIVPPLFFGGIWQEWIYKGLEMLVISCPCALVISTPVTIVTAIGQGSRHGVLIKGGEHLELAGSITDIAFDKTGTITIGQPQVIRIDSPNNNIEEMMTLLASLENQTTHPLAQAILQYQTTEVGHPLYPVENFQIIPGKGIQGDIQGQTYLAGKGSLFDLEVEDDDLTAIFFGKPGQLMTYVGVEDQVRDTSKSVIAELNKLGINTYILTGDHEGTAQKIGTQVGVSQIHANLLPDDKVEQIKRLSQSGTVGMVGDGINDAPALAHADLGIAMGGAGTDTAIETADVVLMADNLEQLPYMVKLSRRALRIIRQNIIFSIGIKFVAMILVFMGILPLWLAVLSDSGAAVLVTLNSLRLRGFSAK